MNKTKIIILGFHKTGTTTLENVLIDKGFKVHGADKQILKIKDPKKVKNYIKDILTKYDVIQDMPWPFYYKEIYDLYPDARYILTYREPEKWIRSVVRYFASIRTPNIKKMYGVPQAEGNEEIFIEKYNELNSQIISFFNNGDNFLILEMNKNFNYQTLNNFLCIDNNETGPLPNSRKNKQKLAKYKLYRDLRSFYINLKKGY